MKDLNTFINRACSKDKTRYNLLHAYRDIDCLVATDGHRMHYIEQPKIERAFSLSHEIGIEYPDYRQCIPDVSSGEYNCIKFQPSKTFLKRLLAIAKLDGAKTPCFELSIEDESITRIDITCKNRDPFFFAQVGEDLEVVKKVNNKRFTCGINPFFLHDALIDCAEILTKLYYKDSSSPLIIEHYNGARALIMPMRIS